MRVFVDQANFQEFQLRDGALTGIRNHEPIVVAQSGVQEFTLAQAGTTIHLVASLQGSLIHWKGEEAFSSQEIGSDAFTGNGLKLLADPSERLHLFYLLRQPRGGSTLHHQVFMNDQWAEPVVVSSNVSIDPKNFVVAWDPQGGVQAVYCGEHDSFLYYRSYNKDQRLWSGAVPLARGQCSRPVCRVFDSDLHLTWVEEEKESILKYRLKNSRWHKEQTLSNTGSSVYESGWNWDSEALKVFWMQGGNLWIRSWDRGEWLGATKGNLSDVQPGLWALVSPDGSSFINLYYQVSIGKKADVPQVARQSSFTEQSIVQHSLAHEPYPQQPELLKQPEQPNQPEQLQQPASQVTLSQETPSQETPSRDPHLQHPTRLDSSASNEPFSQVPTKEPSQREHQLESQLIKQAFYWQKDLTDFKEDLMDTLIGLVKDSLRPQSEGEKDEEKQDENSQKHSFIEDLEEALSPLTQRLTDIESEVRRLSVLLRENQRELYDYLDQKLRTLENRSLIEAEPPRTPYVGKVFRK